MLQHATDTVSFFQAMAPILIANVLTVTFVYCFAKIHQRELAGEQEGRLTYVWLIILSSCSCFTGSTPEAFTPSAKPKRVDCFHSSSMGA